MFNQSLLRPTPNRSHLRRDVERPTIRNSNAPRSKLFGKGISKIPKGPPPRLLHKEEKERLLKKLTPVQYKVTQEKITERPYSNQFYKHFDRGTYSCVVCGEPIFFSQTKYESKSGWPAFYDIIDENKVRYKQDLSHLGANLLLLVCNPSLDRTEVSCAVCNAHLGHVFDDGPKPTGKRFCVNSASLSFSPFDPEKMEGLKRGKEDDEETEMRKKKIEHYQNERNEENQAVNHEPLIHLAASTNSCALGTRICFRVPNMETCGTSTSLS